jgi:hypothetical protein
LQVALDNPDPLSFTVPEILTDGVKTVATFVPAVIGESVTTGDVLSMLNGSLVTDAIWPAASVTLPVTV